MTTNLTATGAVICDDGQARCPWAVGDPALMEYHDTEWGMPVHGETALLERVCLEGFQAGLSWLTVLRKREAFLEAFEGFDADHLAGLSDADLDALLSAPGIIHNARKIAAVRTNARATVALRDDGGLDALLWSYEPAPVEPHQPGDVPSHDHTSRALARDLKARGFVFVGPVSAYATMAAIGLVDLHLMGCHRRGCGAGGPPR